MGPKGCPETSVRNYHYSPRNNPEERSSHMLRGGSLKPRGVCVDYLCLVFECVVGGFLPYNKAVLRKCKAEMLIGAGKCKRSCEGVCIKCEPKCTVLSRRTECLVQSLVVQDVGQRSAVLAMQTNMARLEPSSCVVYCRNCSAAVIITAA